MIARTCAAIVARQIIRAQHISVDETASQKQAGEGVNARRRERAKSKGRKKKKAA
ncbi:MAG TPA: hypothetical protein VF021_02875 [Longimicrobiales bacterium]